MDIDKYNKFLGTSSILDYLKLITNKAIIGKGMYIMIIQKID